MATKAATEQEQSQQTVLAAAAAGAPTAFTPSMMLLTRIAAAQATNHQTATVVPSTAAVPDATSACVVVSDRLSKDWGGGRVWAGFEPGPTLQPPAVGTVALSGLSNQRSFVILMLNISATSVTPWETTT